MAFVSPNLLLPHHLITSSPQDFHYGPSRFASASAYLQVVRKERAVGVVPAVPTVYEVLEEIVFTVQAQLVDTPMPFCAFNGGADVFVDVGNKSLGLESLMHYLNLKPSQVWLADSL